jgi:hypothetical protein
MVTWTFAAELPCGQFANGDWWVVGPVEIVSISQPLQEGLTCTSDDNSGCRSGSGINFLQPTEDHPFDGRALDYSYADDISRQLPYLVDPAGSVLSVVSSVSGAGEQGQNGVITYLESGEILTVVSEVPPDAGSTVFRPPFGDSVKTMFPVSQMDIGFLLDLPVPTNLPSITCKNPSFENTGCPVTACTTVGSCAGELAALISQPYVENRNFSVAPNLLPSYGRERSNLFGSALMWLNVDATQTGSKTELAIQLTQMGIDLYGQAKDGALWEAGGGVYHGKKVPIWWAAIALDDDDIKTVAANHTAKDYQNLDQPFAEAAQTFYIENVHIGQSVSDPNYTADHVGLPEFTAGDYLASINPRIGGLELKIPGTAPGNNGYRVCCNSQYQYAVSTAVWLIDEALAATRGAGFARKLWNDDDYKYYHDRHHDIVDPGEAFQNEVYTAYRDRWCYWVRDDTTDIYSNGHYVCDNPATGGTTERVLCANRGGSCAVAGGNTCVSVSTACSEYATEVSCLLNPCEIGGIGACTWTGSACE